MWELRLVDCFYIAQSYTTAKGDEGLRATLCLIGEIENILLLWVDEKCV